MEFQEGFEYKNFRFGWRKKILYRLPTVKDGREYAMRKVPKIKITDKIKGFRLIRDKKSIAQIRRMTGPVKYKVNEFICKECA